MDILDSIVLGFIQGLTEFLPISSSGHLVLFQKLLGLEKHDIAFDVIVHLATLLSVITIFLKTLLWVFRDIYKSLKEWKVTEGLRLTLFILAGSIPTAFIGLLFKDTFHSFFYSLTATGCFFLITGILLFLTQWIPKGDSESISSLHTLSKEDHKSLSIKKSLLVGLFQGLAIAPGISRSGATIAGGMLIGLKPKMAVVFSFLLSGPAILGATLLELKDVQWVNIDKWALTSGFITAYFTGIFALMAVIKIVNRGRFDLFAYYLWVIGLLSLFLG